MGWLRELMSSGDSKYRSFGVLARAALSHPDWPSDASLQPRSLATLLSKLDRQVDLAWLEDRPEVQLLLASLLGCSAADLAPRRPMPVNANQRVRLTDLRYGRAFDPIDEPLPPGIPELVQRPPEWGALWWVAPNGSGRTLTGNWLRARGLARFQATRRLDHVPAGRGPVFVEVTDGRDRHRPLAPALASLRPLCVAAPFRPPASSAESWTVIESPPIAEFLDELV